MADWTDLRAAAAAVCDPATTPEDLRAIALQQPHLRQAAAEHPQAWPGLFDGLPVAPPVSAPSFAAAFPSPGAGIGTPTLVVPNTAPRAAGWPLDSPDPRDPPDSTTDDEFAAPEVALASPRRRRWQVAIGLAVVIALIAYAVVVVVQYQLDRELTYDQFDDLVTEILPAAVEFPEFSVEVFDISQSGADVIYGDSGIVAQGVWQVHLEPGDEGYLPKVSDYGYYAQGYDGPIWEFLLFEDRQGSREFPRNLFATLDASAEPTTLDWQEQTQSGVQMWQVELSGPLVISSPATICFAVFRNVLVFTFRNSETPAVIDLVDDWEALATGPFKEAVNDALGR